MHNVGTGIACYKKGVYWLEITRQAVGEKQLCLFIEQRQAGYGM
jgi:hypothetical protein